MVAAVVSWSIPAAVAATLCVCPCMLCERDKKEEEDDNGEMIFLQLLHSLIEKTMT